MPNARAFKQTKRERAPATTHDAASTRTRTRARIRIQTRGTFKATRDSGARSRAHHARRGEREREIQTRAFKHEAGAGTTHERAREIHDAATVGGVAAVATLDTAHGDSGAAGAGPATMAISKALSASVRAAVGPTVADGIAAAVAVGSALAGISEGVSPA